MTPASDAELLPCDGYATWKPLDRPRSLEEIALMIERRHKQWTGQNGRDCLHSGVHALSECADAVRALIPAPKADTALAEDERLVREAIEDSLYECPSIQNKDAMKRLSEAVSRLMERLK